MIVLNRTAASFARELDGYRAEAVRRIDARIGEVRLSHITDIPGQANTYLEKEAEARRYLTASPVPSDLAGFPFIAGEVGATGGTPYEVAQVIANLADVWRMVGARLEGLRQQAKAAVAAAESRAEIEAAADLLVEQTRPFMGG